MSNPDKTTPEEEARKDEDQETQDQDNKDRRVVKREGPLRAPGVRKEG